MNIIRSIFVAIWTFIRKVLGMVGNVLKAGAQRLPGLLRAGATRVVSAARAGAARVPGMARNGAERLRTAIANGKLLRKANAFYNAKPVQRQSRRNPWPKCELCWHRSEPSGFCRHVDHNGTRTCIQYGCCIHNGDHPKLPAKDQKETSE